MTQLWRIKNHTTACASIPVVRGTLYSQDGTIIIVILGFPSWCSTYFLDSSSRRQAVQGYFATLQIKLSTKGNEIRERKIGISVLHKGIR